MDPDNGHKSVYYKDKAAYNQALLDAIKDSRKQRVDDPGRGFLNAVLALENILFPEEKQKIALYKFDPADHQDVIDKAMEKVKGTKDERLMVEIFLNEIKPISWPLYKKHCEEFYKEGSFPDLDGNGQVDRKDITICLYEALLSKIIYILQDGGWLTWESEGDVAGGGGGGLSANAENNGVDDDLTPI